MKCSKTHKQYKTPGKTRELEQRSESWQRSLIRLEGKWEKVTHQKHYLSWHSANENNIILHKATTEYRSSPFSMTQLFRNRSNSYASFTAFEQHLERLPPSFTVSNITVAHIEQTPDHQWHTSAVTCPASINKHTWTI